MIKQLYTLRWLLVACIAALAIALFPGLQRAVRVNNSLKIWFLEDSPQLDNYESFQTQFGGDEVLIVVLHHPEGMLSRASLEAQKNLSTELENSPYVERIFSLTQSEVVKTSPLGVYTSPLFTPSMSEEKRIRQVDKYQSQLTELVSEDKTTTQILVQLHVVDNMDEVRGEMVAELREMVDKYQSDVNLYMGGVGVIFEGLNALSKEDFGKFLSIAYVLMLVLVWVLFRRISIVFFALLVISSATFFTLGIYGALGYRLNLMSTLIPVIISLLGLLDVIHIVNEKYQMQSHGVSQLGIDALKKVWRPCLLTTLTTMAGFLSLLSTPLPVIREFGVFSALGILLCLLFSFFYALFFIVPPSSYKPLPFALEKLFNGLINYRKYTRTAILTVFVLSIWGIPKIVVDTDTLSYLPKSHRVVQDHENIMKHWGPYMPFEMVFTSGTELTDSTSFLKMVEVSRSLDTNSVVAKQLSIFSLYDKNVQDNGYISPTEFLSGLQEFYPQYYTHLVDSMDQTARVTLFGELSSASELNVTASNITQSAQTQLGALGSLKPAGYLPIYAQVVNHITEGQIWSLILTLGLVFGLVWIFFKSARLAAIALLTNLFPVTVMFGTMGWLGIRIDLATASIAAIGLSFCIDDSIHFLYSYHHHRENGKSISAAYRKTFLTVGQAILISSLVLFTGYVVLGFGQLKTVYLFGLLISEMVATALFAQWIIFPWLLDLASPNEEQTP